MRNRKISKIILIFLVIILLGGGLCAGYIYREDIKEFFTHEQSKSDTIQYKVTFETNVENQIQDQYVVGGTFVEVPADPYKEGYRFLGWAVNGEIVDLSTYKIISDTNFVAVFEKMVKISDWNFGMDSIGYYLGNEIQIENIPTSYTREDKVVEVCEVESVYEVNEKLSFNGSNFEEIYKSFYLTANNLERTFFEDCFKFSEYCEKHGDPEGPITLEICETKFYEGNDYSITKLGMYPFVYSNVEKIVLPEQINVFYHTDTFSGANSLKELLIYSKTKIIVEKETSDIIKLPEDCKIFVRDDLIDLYKNDALWPSDQIYKLSEYDNITEGITQCKVQFVIEGQDPILQYVNKGKFVTFSQIPEKEGYTFKGWAVNGEIVDLSTYAISTDTTFVAIFEENQNIEERITDFIFEGSTLTKYVGDANDVVIPLSYSLNEDGKAIVGEDIQITSLGSQAFYGNSNIESVFIPEGITSIGGNCFASCRSLVSVRLPNTLTSLDYCCFYSCGSLKEISIPEGITNLPFACFKYCFSLEKVDIPVSVESIEQNCFVQCESLASITLRNEKVCNIDKDAFYLATTNIYVPSSLFEEYKTSYPSLANYFLIIIEE